jgi:hypothetical protein
MRRGRLPTSFCRHVDTFRVDGPERLSGRNACPSGMTPSNILSPAAEPTRRSWTEVRLGARAQHRCTKRAHAPPGPATNQGCHLTPHARTSKKRIRRAGSVEAVDELAWCDDLDRELLRVDCEQVAVSGDERVGTVVVASATR